ncbi:MAG: glycerate kinase, partial [Chthoniobacterales bacterium]
MRILIAPDKFKGSLGAEAVAQQIATGLRAVLPEAILELMPIADGGEGTAEVICRARQGDWITCLAQDALGRVQTARYAWIASSNQAVMDMSATAGLSQLAHGENQIMQASTFGVGEMLLHAVAQQVSEVVIGLGGSATNDGGFGLARALGFRFLAEDQRELFDLSSLPSLRRIVRPNDLALPRLIAACDVRNVLLGADGATHALAAQKGATAAEVKILEHTLARLAEVATETFGRDDSALPGA